MSSANESTSSSTVGKQSGSTRTSRFGRLNFGAQILQKTVGLVLGPRQGRQVDHLYLHLGPPTCMEYL